MCCTVLCCTVLCCTVLYCTALYLAVLYCAVLYSTVLYCTVLCCTVLYCTALYCAVLYCAVLYCAVLYCAVLCCTILYFTVLYCAVLYCAVLYCTLLYCAVLYCTVLYCTVLYCTVLYCTDCTGSESGLDFQCVLAGSEHKLVLQLKNKGKFDIGFSFSFKKASNGHSYADLFKLTPTSSVLYPTEKWQLVNVAFCSSREVAITDEPILTCQVCTYVTMHCVACAVLVCIYYTFKINTIVLHISYIR